MEYRKGAKDKDVGVIQSLLNRAREKAISSQQYKIPNDWEYLKIDNDFGERTERAVKGFQTICGITPISGIVGNTTWNYLDSFTPSIRAVPNFTGEYKIGSTGAEVREIQQLLNRAWSLITSENRHLKWEYISVDGIFGIRTDNAVRCFQEYRKITPISGVVGRTTLEYLRNFNSLIVKGGELTKNTKTDISKLIEQLKEPVSRILQVVENFISNVGLNDKNNTEQKIIDKLKREFRLAVMVKDRAIKEAKYQIQKCSKNLNSISKTIKRALKSYNVSQRIKDEVAKYEHQNNKTKVKIKAWGFIGFLLNWGELISLICQYENTIEWEKKMELCLYKVLDQLIVDLVVAFCSIVLLFFGVEVGIVTIIGFIVYVICATIIWLLEDKEIYLSEYLMDVGDRFSANYYNFCYSIGIY